MTWIRFALAIAWILFSVATSPLPLQAQTDRNDDPGSAGSPPERTHGGDSASPGIPTQRQDGGDSGSAGRPTQRQDGGDRGCSALNIPANQHLTALVPARNEALTTTQSPTLLFYVPYTSSSTVYARFSLLDENENDLVEPMQVTLSGTPGIISLRLPKPLEAKKPYYWAFAIICDRNDTAKDRVVYGWIQRIEPSPALVSQLKEKASPRERAALYAKEGFFLDALALLAEIRYTDPQADTDWSSVLQSLQLDDIAPEKIVQCCTLKP